MKKERVSGDWDVNPVLTGREWVAAAGKINRPSTPDDVTITMDGRRLDTKEKLLAFLAEIEVGRLAGKTIADKLP